MENRILVVDDEVDLVKTIRFSLETEGYTVLASNDGAVKKARNSKKIYHFSLLKNEFQKPKKLKESP